MRRGVSILEIVMTLALLGALVTLAVPGATYLADRLAVEQEVARLLTAHRSAWMAASSRRHLALLRITPDTLAIRTVRSAGAADTLLVWLAPGPKSAGVSLTSPAHTTVFGPDGVAMGLSNARHVLERGGARREVVVSRLGRVRVSP